MKAVGVLNGVSSPSPAPRPRARSGPLEMNNSHKARRSLLLNKPKSGDHALGSQKPRDAEEVKVMGRSRNRPVVDQLAPRRPSEGPEPDDKTKELQGKLDLRQNLINNLQSEVLGLKAELDKAQSFNLELQSLNAKLTEDLAAALAKITALTSRQQEESVTEYQSPKFKDIQKLIANKLEHPKIKQEASNEASTVQAPSAASVPRVPRAMDSQRKVPPCPAPPPPPLPPPQPPARAAATRKAPTLVEFYHSLTKGVGKRDFAQSGNHNKLVVSSAHSSIVGEIQNRSAHQLAIKADIETKGDFINGLIQRVLAAAYSDMEDIVKFVDWLDNELSTLADERAVLKHFKWPERKADAMREAAIEYRDLKLLESEVSCYKDNANVPCGVALKKMAGLLDKSERSIQRLIKLRNSVVRSYQECGIPTGWMLDSGIVSKIKQASINLAKMYMQRVAMELESVRNSERESSQEALLLQGVHFAYRAHQFAGGLDSETLCAFEEIRQRVPEHLGGSRELLAGIPSS